MDKLRIENYETDRGFAMITTIDDYLTKKTKKTNKPNSRWSNTTIVFAPSNDIF